MVNRYYSVLLSKKDEPPRTAADADLGELLACLLPENPVERNMYRKEVNSANNTKFVRLNKGEKGQAA